jgi:hypothetical protein
VWGQDLSRALVSFFVAAPAASPQHGPFFALICAARGIGFWPLRLPAVLVSLNGHSEPALAGVASNCAADLWGKCIGSSPVPQFEKLSYDIFQMYLDGAAFAGRSLQSVRQPSVHWMKWCCCMSAVRHWSGHRAGEVRHSLRSLPSSACRARLRGVFLLHAFLPERLASFLCFQRIHPPSRRIAVLLRLSV